MGFAARFTKRTAVIATVAALALGGGLAWAAWTVTGSGSSTAQAGSAQGITFEAGAPDGQLFPNEQPVAVHASVTNPNPFPVNVTVPSSAAVTASGGCNASSLTFTPAAVFTVAAGATDVDVVVGTLSMDNTANNSCQGATFTVDLSTVVAESA